MKMEEKLAWIFIFHVVFLWSIFGLSSSFKDIYVPIAILSGITSIAIDINLIHNLIEKILT